MLSLEDMMTFPISEKNFLENNLLDTEDWDKGYLSHCENSTSSLSSDEFTSLDSNPSPLQEDNIDSWLQEELSLFIPPDKASKHFEEPIYIKQEPSSPTSPFNENSADVTSIYKNTLIFPSNISIKVPISRYKSGDTSISQVTSSSVQSIPTHDNNTNIIRIQKLVPVSSPDLSGEILMSDHHPNTITTIPYTAKSTIAVTANSNITTQPLTLENGQKIYFSQTNGKTEPLTNNSKVISKTGVKREASVKVEELLPPPKTLNELKNYKRQQRMIKNRESACLSRQRKKQHLQELQEHASQMALLNQQLKEENNKLKERIQKLESENMTLRESPNIKMTMKEAAKKSTVLLTILVIFVFIPFRISNKDILTKRDMQMPVLHKSRSLLQFDNSNIHQEHIAYQNSAYDSRKVYPQRINILNDIFNNVKDRSSIPNVRRQGVPRKGFSVNNNIKTDMDISTGDVGCEEHFNKTHVNRIKQALEGLAKGFAKEENQNSKQININKTAVTDSQSRNATFVKSRLPNCNQSQPRHKPPRLTNLKSLRQSKFRKIKSKEPSIPKYDSQALFEIIQRSIQRKPDTFYVVSLLKDTFILPATSVNSTRRPKVTLMFPAHLPNNTALNGSTDIPMLQIDCNVIDTKLMRFQRDTKYLLT